ncbi:MAG: Nif3-like dinuclear metal center hexameric protein [Bacteroidota bacterium]|nr:Nif3-like dinuclear metal center hexameric protein [Bacteroidota bacterium]
MQCKEIFKFIENWAPKAAAWPKDNPGLQVGYSDNNVSGVLLCLEVTPKVVEEAIKKKLNLIISHHPFLFRPLSKIDIRQDQQAKIIESLIKNEITLYSAHTNLDFTKDGVSFQLAKKLELNNIQFLQYSESNQCKIIVFVPETDVERISEVLFESGCGNIGEYSGCSFRTSGIGTFKGSELSSPVIGEKGKLETVKEIKLEALADKWRVNEVIARLVKAHPYEEPAIDIIPVNNYNKSFGVGTIGELASPMTKNDFFRYVTEKLNLKNFRYADAEVNEVKKVALCGGSGFEVLPYALKQKADVLITADVKYHNFLDTNGCILLIDAGHYETEIVVLDEVEKRIKDFLKDDKISVFKFSGSTNPINYYR